uniref:Membrane protein-like protein n=1 Tax=Ectopseudomonas mendocina (strain ymp) TaxID=399739 RepID=A4XRP1_ECTM1
MLKTLTFTIMHFCIAFSVAYVLTGSIAVSGLVAAVEPLCNSVGFYFHEKIWARLEAKKRASSIPKHAWLHHQA